MKPEITEARYLGELLQGQSEPGIIAFQEIPGKAHPALKAEMGSETFSRPDLPVLGGG
jgi:hypothetical protein